MSPTQRRRRLATSALLAVISLGLFVVPGVTVLRFGLDPATSGPGIASTVRSWHRSYSRRYEPWARARIASDRATKLSQHDISGTEWPLFGTVFYLLATEEIEKATTGDERPSFYARGAILAAGDLLADPKQADWVKVKYGPDYLHKENVFYRALLVFGLTCVEKLTGDTTHHGLLLDQMQTLPEEFSPAKAPHGLAEDYPGECYPSDVLWTICAIRRADPLVGMDHSALVARTREKFQRPEFLGPRGLPPYTAEKSSGIPGEVRGCSCSSQCIFAPEIDVAMSKGWFERYERDFWQEKLLFRGFREFPVGDPRDWYADVDAGPSVAGFGVAANAFGVGAARANGRFDRAVPLAGESVAWGWPMIDGSLLVPGLLSNATDAPLLGEAGVLFNLTRQPLPGVTIVSGGAHAGQFWLLLFGGYFGVPLLVALREWRRWRKWQQGGEGASPGRERGAMIAFAVLVLTGVVLLVLGFKFIALGAWMFAIALPEAVGGRAKNPVAPSA